MIEHKSLNDFYDTPEWDEVPNAMSLRSVSFWYNIYRIRGQVYSEQSLKFQTAWEQERMWERLSD